jgi:hypothetical protein
MHEAQVEKIIKKAVQRERRLWLSVFAFAFIFSLYRTPVHVVDRNTMAFQTSETLPVNRRMLQATAMPEKGKFAASTPATEFPLSELTNLPAAEDLSSPLSQEALFLTPSPEAESLDVLSAAPTQETLMPLKEKNSTAAEIQQQECQCPPGPAGPSGPKVSELHVFSTIPISLTNKIHFPSPPNTAG